MQEIKDKQESSAQSSTVEEIIARIKQCIKDGIGRAHCRCGEPIHPEHVQMYPHSHGIQIEDIGKQWVYIHCPSCRYDWALWKLHMKLDKAREVIPCQ